MNEQEKEQLIEFIDNQNWIAGDIGQNVADLKNRILYGEPMSEQLCSEYKEGWQPTATFFDNEPE